jgi:C4-dicarboxylate transporter
VATDRYPTPEFRRTALAPAILATIVLIAGVPLLETDLFTVIRFVVSILALITTVFAIQAGSTQASAWVFVVLLSAIAVLWNPVVPIPLEGQLGYGLHYLAGVVFLVAGIRIKIRNDEDKNTR